MSSQREVQLDPYGDNVPPAGYTLVEDPVTLIEVALGDVPLYVRGVNLCRWADDLAFGRGWKTNWLKSPMQELKEQCPYLSDEEAQVLVAQLGDRLSALRRPIELNEVLCEVWGEATLWASEPEVDHAFHWLTWLSQQAPDEPQMKLVGQQAQTWELKAPPQLRRAYSVRSATEAWSLLKEWLKVAEAQQEWPPPPRFPLLGDLSHRLQDDLTREAVETDTDFFIALVSRAPDRDLLTTAANVCAEVLISNPQKATGERVRRLERYLPYDVIQKLNDLIRPPDPGLPEWDFGHIENWYTRKYIPYREWTSRHGAASGDEGWVAVHAREFARHFLRYYARARVGGDGAARLAWQKSASLWDAGSDEVHLLVVLDGLTYPDALRLSSHIQQSSRRLLLDGLTLAVAPLPTVTEFAKFAVAKGMLPSDALADTARRVYTSLDAVNQAANNATRGTVLAWALLEPDRTYHFRADAGPSNARLEAEAQLAIIARHIASVAEKVPNDVHLRIFITTDHGRLLTNAVRTRPIPNEMKSHGRAAWGTYDIRFDHTGYLIDDDIAYLHPLYFGLPEGQVYAVIVSDEAFLTANARGGSEPFPHGGLFPEEVLIPWIEFTRDREPPQVVVALTGKGEEGKAGGATLTIGNLGPVSITLVALTVDRLGTRVDLVDEIGAFDKKSIAISLPRWPSRKDLRNLAISLTYLLPDGQPVKHPIQPELETESLYETPDILDQFGRL